MVEKQLHWYHLLEKPKDTQTPFMQDPIVTNQSNLDGIDSSGGNEKKQ